MSSQAFENLERPLLLETFREFVARRKTNRLSLGPRPDSDFESDDDPVKATYGQRAKKRVRKSHGAGIGGHL